MRRDHSPFLTIRVDLQEMQDQQVTSLKDAVAQAMVEKEDTFEHLGEARERNAEMQDALREANAQLRMLQVRPHTTAAAPTCCLTNS